MAEAYTGLTAPVSILLSGGSPLAVVLPVSSSTGFTPGMEILLLSGPKYAKLIVEAVPSGSSIIAAAYTSSDNTPEGLVDVTFPPQSEVCLFCKTRELVLGYSDGGQQLSYDLSTPFRYPYLPENWSGVSHSGLLQEHSRTDVKTFTNNISVSWEAVLQDVTIKETFQSMDYNFFHSLWSLYMARRHCFYRPRDISLEEYEVEIVDIKPGKQHRFWVDGVTIELKVHRVVRTPYNDYTWINNRVLPPSIEVIDARLRNLPPLGD